MMMLKNSLKMLLAGLMVVMFAADGWGARATVNGIVWQYAIENGSAIIKNESSSYSSAIPSSTSGEIVIPSKLGGYPVTYIGDYAFYNCSRLTSVTIPNSVTNIGSVAFRNCNDLVTFNVSFGNLSYKASDGVLYSYDGTALISYPAGKKGDFSIPDSVTNIDCSAFYGCSELTSVTIPDSVTSIRERAFFGCSGLTSMTIGNGVTNIEWEAFYGCSGFKTVNYLGNIDSWCEIEFKGSPANPSTYAHKLLINGQEVSDLVIPDGVTNIKSYVFSSCDGLTSVTIPDSVTRIGEHAFSGCNGLTSVTIPDSVTSIGSFAFNDTGLYNAVDNGLVIIDGWVVGLKNYSGDLMIGEGIKGIADSAFSGCVGLTSVTIPDSVTCIGNSAFFGCSRLGSVTIPGSITNIGHSTFYNCRGMTSVTIPDGVTSIGSSAFYNCTGLTSVTIPNSVTNIGYNAFYGCNNITTANLPGIRCEIPATSLTTVVINDGVTNIGNSAFYNYSRLTSVTIPNSVTSIGTSAFSGCSGLESVMIPGSVTNIDFYAFHNCSRLTSVTIPDSVTNIDFYAFYGCKKITTAIGWVPGIPTNSLIIVSIKNGVTSIRDSEFYYCRKLAAIEIPNSVTNVGANAFYHCTKITTAVLPGWLCGIPANSLRTLTISDGVTSIAANAFSGCDFLETVTIPSSVTNISDMAFGSFPNGLKFVVDEGNQNYSSANGLLFNKEATELVFWLSANGEVEVPPGVTKIRDRAFTGCRGVTSMIIPNGVTDIGNFAFYGCSRLTSVTIPDSVISIGKSAFYNCAGLKSVTIPDRVLSIGDCTFSGCNGLTSVTIPDSVTSIGDSAFYNCVGLTSVTIPEKVARIEDSTFSGCSGLTSVVIPDSVTSIGDFAFSNCVELTSVTLPDKLAHIGDRAFFACSGLSSVVVPSHLTSLGSSVFSGCTGLVTATLRDGLGMVGDSMFSGCTGLVSVAIPNSVTNIGNHAFYNCSSLASATLPGNLTGLGESAFSGCVRLRAMTVPGGVREISANAFYGCIGLTSVTLGDGVESIGDSAFEGCEWLTSVTVPGTVGSVGGRAFYDCKSLNSVMWMGDCPATTGTSVFNRSLTHYIRPSATGWRTTFCGYPVVLKYDYYVVFKENGGTGIMDGQYFEFAETKPLSRNTFVRSESVFQGWATSPNGPVVYADGAEVRNLTATKGATVYLYAVWGVSSVPVPTITPSDGRAFTGESCEVTITCELGGAAIYYTTNGTTPRVSATYLYTGPFTIHDTTTIKAVAVSGTVKSAYQTATITRRTLTLADAVGASDGSGMTIATGGDAVWTPVFEDWAVACGDCAVSGVIGDNGWTWLEVSVRGAGTFSFWWKCSCEHDEDNALSWDHLSYAVDGVERERIDGESGWTCRTVEFTTAGTHTIRWTYVKDGEAADGADCAWVDALSWAPAVPAVGTVVVADKDGREITIETSWFEDQAEKLSAKFGSRDWAAVAKMATGKTDAGGRALTVLDDYIAGTDLTDEDDTFKVSIKMGADGKPVIVWEPALNDDETHKGVKDGVRSYKVFGNTGLSAEGWTEVEQDATGDWRRVDTGEIVSPQFFKVSVAMP